MITLEHLKESKLNASTLPYVPSTLIDYLTTLAHLEGMNPQPSAFKSVPYTINEAY